MNARKALSKGDALAVSMDYGAWTVEMTWPRDADQGNPWEIRIRPTEGATTEDAFGGIPATLLRRIDLAEAVSHLHTVYGRSSELRQAVDAIADSLAAAARRNMVDDFYLATLSAAYVALVQLGSPSVTEALANMTGKASETVRIHLKRARSAGLLTAGAKGRAGGQLTDKAKAILGL